MSDSITIRVRRDEQGFLIGVTASDRWNLDTLATFDGIDLTDGEKPLTKGQIDRARRNLAAMGFKLVVVRQSVPITWDHSAEEHLALTPALPHQFRFSKAV